MKHIKILISVLSKFGTIKPNNIIIHWYTSNIARRRTSVNQVCGNFWTCNLVTFTFLKVPNFFGLVFKQKKHPTSDWPRTIVQCFGHTLVLQARPNQPPHEPLPVFVQLMHALFGSGLREKLLVPSKPYLT